MLWITVPNTASLWVMSHEGYFSQCRQYQACHQFFQRLPGRSLGLPGIWQALPCVPRCRWRPMHWFCQLWDLITLGFWSNNSQILPDVPRDINTFCGGIEWRNAIIIDFHIQFNYGEPAGRSWRWGELLQVKSVFPLEGRHDGNYNAILWLTYNCQTMDSTVWQAVLPDESLAESRR